MWAFAGLALGGFVYSRRGVNRWTIRDTFLSILPDENLKPIYASNRRTLVSSNRNHLRCLVGIGRIHSTAYRQGIHCIFAITTGVPFGFGLGLFSQQHNSARPNKFSSAGQVRLPGNVRFQKVTQEEE